jgi:hypothetical protein
MHLFFSRNLLFDDVELRIAEPISQRLAPSPPPIVSPLTKDAFHERVRFLPILRIRTFALNGEVFRLRPEIFCQGHEPVRNEIVATQRHAALNQVIVPAWV